MKRKIIKIITIFITVSFFLLMSLSLSSCELKRDYTSDNIFAPNNGKEFISNHIYTIEEVYNARGIGFEDLLNLAYYSGNEKYNFDKFQGFEPKEKDEIEEAIMILLKAKLAEVYNERESKEEYKATINDFEITYYGCYNGFVAFKSRRIDEEYPTEIIEEWETIG